MNFLFAETGRGRAYDDASSRRHRCGRDDIAKAAAFAVVVDSFGDANLRAGGHVDEVLARQRHVGGDTRAFRPHRLLGDLDDDLLAASKLFFDRDRFAGVRVIASVGRARALLLVDHVRRVQKGGLLES